MTSNTPTAHQSENPTRPAVNLIPVGVPIALGIVMIGAGLANFAGSA